MIIVPTEKRFDWNNAPIVLFAIVIINVMVFYAYQTGDSEQWEEAIRIYVNDGLYEQELPHYKDYLRQNQAIEELELLQELEHQPNRYITASLVLVDEAFYEHLKGHATEYFDLEYRQYWQFQREHIHQLLYGVSYREYGLVANDLKLTNLITHQFLHGSTMHLVGNMFFLIVCGFAVEAALGHRNFLLFYLMTGVGAGLAQAWMDLNSSVPMVGASGAVSGVMAMYLGIFRLKKIEFFYWLFVFVGYFRAPALFILPFYIGKELYALWNQPDSNVAFMAHVGGFATGALLMGLTLWMKPDMLNQQYIEEDQSASPAQVSLDGVYRHMEKLQLSSALQAINLHLKNFGASFDLLVMKYKLLQVIDPDQAKQQLQYLIMRPNPSLRDMRQIEDIWQSLPAAAQAMDPDTQYKLAWNFMANAEHIDHAIKLFQHMYQAEPRHPTLHLLAKKIAFAYQKLENRVESERYKQIAQELS
ncbi:rhomboid family intramembrane serine protease [Marinicella meishanensis]|uniref:rhomboid family intramembrane serine protease n=1 Tax=Marinicella meishanensis TaxID=2873263 RepID=UPI001CBEF131|nr:rhomboid family intramembrane serine protease [Marinicella sp. NBU2979]